MLLFGALAYALGTRTRINLSFYSGMNLKRKSIANVKLIFKKLLFSDVLIAVVVAATA